MILRRLGGGFGRGRGLGLRCDSASADDGKRFVEVPSGTELRGTFHSISESKRYELYCTRGRVREGERARERGPIFDRRIYKILVFPFVFEVFLLPKGLQDGIDVG